MSRMPSKSSQVEVLYFMQDDTRRLKNNLKKAFFKNEKSEPVSMELNRAKKAAFRCARLIFRLCSSERTGQMHATTTGVEFLKTFFVVKLCHD